MVRRPCRWEDWDQDTGAAPALTSMRQEQRSSTSSANTRLFLLRGRQLIGILYLGYARICQAEKYKGLRYFTGKQIPGGYPTVLLLTWYRKTFAKIAQQKSANAQLGTVTYFPFSFGGKTLGVPPELKGNCSHLSTACLSFSLRLPFRTALKFSSSNCWR